MEAERIKAVYAITDGQTEFGLSLLTSNNQFSRKVIAGSTSLLARMIVLQTIHRDARIVSELIHMFPQISVEHADTLAQILDPISSQNLSLRRAFEFEVAMAINLLETDVFLADSSNLSISL